MNQKLNDFKMMVQTDRRIWAGAGFFLFVILLVAFSSKSTGHRASSAGEVAGNNPGNGATEAYNDLTIAFREQLDSVSRNSADNANVIKKISRDMEEYKERTTSIFQTLVDRMEELNREIDRLAEVSAGGGGARGSLSISANEDDSGIPGGLEPDALEPIGFDNTDIPLPPPEPKPQRVSVITPGDVVSLKLLTGVNAPTDGTPYPVVFKLTGPIGGPDGSALDVGEARLIAAAQGSESDGRVLFRLTNLAIRHKNGSRSVVPVDGWIVGEDGVRGMKGRLIDKLGRLIMATFATSYAGALGESLSDRADAVAVTEGGVFELSGDEYDAAAAGGFSDAADKLGDILIERYEALVPVVEVLSGRDVMAVFSSQAQVATINEDEYSEAIYTTASLD